MRDDISVGSAPCEEECRRFLELVRKKLGQEPPGARLAIKGNPHDFGTYYDVVCYFDTDDEEARQYAFRCERHAPRTWTDDHLSAQEIEDEDT